MRVRRIIPGMAWAIQLIASTALLSGQAPAPTTHLVPLFPEGRGASEREGFIRIVNHSEHGAAVHIAAFDEDGRKYGPVTLTMDGSETVHLAPGDLVRGNRAKGVSGATGSGWDNGRLELSSGRDIMVLSYIRHRRDGFLTSMHDVVPREGNRYTVRTFNPGSEANQVSRLRLINTGLQPATVRIRGIDDRGVPSPEATISVPAGATREFTAAELESGTSGTGMNGSLGHGIGKWRLVLESEDPLVVMNLLENPTGYLANLSTVPWAAKSGAWTVPLFPSTSDPWERQGLVRIINHSARDGEVRVAAFDGSQERNPPFTTPIEAGQTVHLDSDDLEEKLSGGVGSGEGNRHLAVSSDLDIEVLSYIEHADGLLTSMHDVAPLEGHRLSAFKPGSGSDRDPGSRLRLINTGEAEAQVTVEAIDDRGSSLGSAFEVTVPAGAARELTAADMGFGGGATGASAGGSGNWRLVIDSEETVTAMSLLESSTGHLANLSTEPQRDPVLVLDHYVETSKGNPAGIAVSVVDTEGFDPGAHGQRITDTFLDRTRHASLVQIREWGEYGMKGVELDGINMAGYARHALTRDRGIFWTATDESPLYLPHRTWAWFVKQGRPFTRAAREFANWMRDRDVLFISSVENATCAGTPPQECIALYCDDFEPDVASEEGWIPMCGEFDDYVAHSGVGLDIVLFASALSGNHASGAIRADGVFAPHTIYVESPDGSTSHAAAVLAAYATNLSFANPSWGAARVKRELMALAREVTVEYYTGGIDEAGTSVTEHRTVKAIVTRTEPFTDDPIVPGMTPVRAVHFAELRARIDVLRGGAALAPFGWTDPVLRAGVTPARLAHLLELREALTAVYAAAGRSAPRWTDAAPVGGAAPIRAAHLSELRAAVLALE